MNWLFTFKGVELVPSYTDNGTLSRNVGHVPQSSEQATRGSQPRRAVLPESLDKCHVGASGTSQSQLTDTHPLLMTTPNEIEYERELIRRGRQKTIKELEEKERQEYYSQTTSGRWTMQNHFMPFAESLEETTKGAFEGIIKRTNISRCCGVIDALIDYLNPNGAFHISATTIKVIVIHTHTTNGCCLQLIWRHE